MSAVGPYATAAAFRTALETRLSTISKQQQVAIPRLRKAVAFDRLLARLFAHPDVPWLLKGGYAMELRLHWAARGTRDVDLAVPQTRADVTGDIRTSARRDIADGFEYRVGESIRELEGPPGGGGRLPVECVVDARLFEQFHLDFGIGDDVSMEPERIMTGDLLAFAGILPVPVLAVPCAVQFAEKIHAYTYPRLNSRDRDLVDMLLLIRGFRMSHREVRDALNRTFSRSQTHALPRELPRPPAVWKEPYRQKAAEVGLGVDLDAAYEELAAFYAALMREAP